MTQKQFDEFMTKHADTIRTSTATALAADLGLTTNFEQYS